VGTSSTWTFANRTTDDSLGSNFVTGVYAVGSTVYAATTGGLSISTDGGANFTNYTTDDSLGNNNVQGVYASGSTVYAATAGGVSISTDGGANFTNYTTDDSLGDNFVQEVYAVESTVYAATNGGLSISANLNATPAFTNYTTDDSLGSNIVLGVYVTDGTVYAATFGGLSISTDGGASFANRTTDDSLGSNFVLGVYVVGGTVYAATAGGLSISTDGGTTFTNRTFSNSGLGSEASKVVYGVHTVGSTVYAATFGGLSISTDGGANFTNYSLGDSDPNPVFGVFAVGGTVYAATQNYGLFIGSPPPLAALPVASSVVVGAAGTVTISSTAPALPDDTVVTAVSADTGVATVISSVNASDGTAAFTVTGVTAGTTNVTFSATGYTSVVVPVTVTALPPPPPPVFPPSAPGSVTGVAGDRSAVLSWAAPASSGSFPISTYQAVVSPGGQSCLVAVPALTCTISGLTNGASYTATVRALNGAGWGPWSADSDPVTPEAPETVSVLISGARSDARGRRPGVIVAGTATGVGSGAIMRPMVRFPGQASYTQGSALIVVDQDGVFTWQRRTGKKTYVYVVTQEGTARSNRVIIPAR
jgi:hypothetical protein